MKRVTLALAGALTLVLAVGNADAGTQDGAVVALHVKAHAASSPIICPGHVNVKTGLPDSVDPNTKLIPCSQYVTTWDFNLDIRADVYLVIAKANPADGIAGVSCGILYDANILGSGWNLCADLHFPNGPGDPEPIWPGSGGGDRITWAPSSNCQDEEIGTDGVHAIAGAFYVYIYPPGGVMTVTPNNNLQSGPELKIADCSASESNAAEGAKIAFSATGEAGCNPCVEMCGGTPVEQTTWGRIKTSHE